MSKTYVILNDIQYPFHDEQCLALVKLFIKDIKPDGVRLNGDIVDCYSISSFTKDPMHRADLLTERRYAQDLMGHIAKYSQDNMWLEGNHEKRLWRLIADRAPALGVFEEVSFPKLFKLDNFGFKWSPYGDLTRLGHLRITHGELVRKDSGATAKAYWNRYRTSVLIGHTQRFGAFYITCLGEQYACFENACLCDLRPDYTPNPDWQQGFSVVHVASDKTYNVQQIPIFKRDGRAFCMYGPERYETRA